jgi:hypothetical protein
MRRSALVLAVVAALGTLVDTAAKTPSPEAEAVRLELAKARAIGPSLGAQIDPIITASMLLFDRRAAFGHVQFMSEYWRLAGNEGFDKSIDRARQRLLLSGFADGKQASRPSVWVEESPNQGKGWDHSVGTLALVHPGQPDQILLSRDRDHIALCINSFSTVDGGMTAPLVDVGKGDRDEDYAAKDVKGAVVLGDADVGTLWRRAVTAHGAVGVISTALGSYVNPDNANSKVVTPHDKWDILQWGSIPYDDAKKGFGFKSTPHAAATMRKALAGGAARVHVTIKSTFSMKPTRMLIAEFPGRTLPKERMVIVAHVQEPGAADNASGAATLTELARALARNLGRKTIPQPERTITLIWLEEISGSRAWLAQHQDEAAGVRYMFSMDMTGERVSRTGGSFLIERWPDPGAVWERPWDPHSEWGSGNVRADSLKGDLINDVHLAVCERVAARSNWIVRSNPYEGGSDHTVFGQMGVPALLNWHFTDRFYHTSFDTPDKTSSFEMRNVAASVTASAWLLASANETMALSVARVVSRAGEARVAVEEREGAKLAHAQADPTAALVHEATIVKAWRQWYDQAVRSVTRLVTGPTTPRFATRVEELAAPFAEKK